MIAPFVNETCTDFTVEAHRKGMLAALAAVEARFGAHYPLIVGGREIRTEKEIASLNPSNPSEVVGFASSATPEIADQAVRAAYEAFREWSRWEPEARARILLRAASIMRRRRFELDAVEVLEAGKPWLEADGDVAEAIDFCEFYAREAMRYGGPQRIASRA